MPSLIQPSLFDLLDGPAFPRPTAVKAAIETLASNSGIEARGAIFTRIEVVDFILDLAGYVSSEPLHRRRILEPSFGKGDFLLPIVERLLAAWREHGGDASTADAALGAAIRGVELHRDTFVSTRKAVINRLIVEGLSETVASELAGQWLTQGDFLLEQQSARFDVVVGNPPYVRQELIPAALLAQISNNEFPDEL